MLLLQRIVYVRVVFVKIGDIDTVKECFEANIYLEATWREPMLDSYISQSDAQSIGIDEVSGKARESIWQS